MPFRRSSGVLLHPTALPGRFGIGDLGPSAFAFIDLLASAGQRLWQVLPLGPTGYGDSPYQLFTACAGNPLLITSTCSSRRDCWPNRRRAAHIGSCQGTLITRASSHIDGRSGR